VGANAGEPLTLGLSGVEERPRNARNDTRVTALLELREVLAVSPADRAAVPQSVGPKRTSRRYARTGTGA